MLGLGSVDGDRGVRPNHRRVDLTNMMAMGTDDPNQDLPTEHLARGAKSGDRERATRLFERVAPSVYAWATLRISPGSRALVDPEDVVQEICFRVLTRFHTFDPESSRFRPWVFGIANKVMLEAFKKIRGRPVPRGGGSTSQGPPGMDAIPDDATRISRRVARDEGLTRFVEQVASLSKEERRLFLFRGLEGLSHEEVARRLEIGADVVRKRWQRLRTRLEDMEGADELFDSDEED